MSRFVTCLATVLVAAAVAFAGVAPGAEARTPDQELRGLWVDAFGEGLNTPAEIAAVVDTAKAANLNAIFAQVVRRGDCWCNDASVPRTQAAISPLPFDPLRTLIERAHAEGIEVHAWVVVTAIWNSTTPPVADDHVFNTHGPGAAGSSNWLMRRSDGADRGGADYYLDPGHPAAARHVITLVNSLVDNYEIDGINLDRIRYPDHNLGTNVPSWGYNPTALTRFQRATGRSDRPAPTDAQWAQWRRDQITNLVRRIYLETFARDPEVRVSADTITYGPGPEAQGGWTRTRTYREVLQDWRGWMAEGILDLNVPMNYKRHDATAEPNNQRRMYREWNTYIADRQYRRQAVVGSGLYLNTIADSVAQVRSALATTEAGNAARGWVGYSYRNPDRPATEGQRSGAVSRRELVRALTTASPYDPRTPPVFAGTARVPGMPWKTAPTRGHVRGRVRTLAGRSVDQADVRLFRGAEMVARRSTDGSGWVGFVDLPPGSYRAAVRIDGDTGERMVNVPVSAGRLSTITLTPSRACPPGAVPPAGFSDTAGSVHRQAIDCLAWYDITDGVTPTEFRPGRRVTRGQMASFVARTLEAVDPALLPAPTDQGFTDLAGTVHRDAINQLAELGVVRGRAATEYDPEGRVSRGQTASMLAGVHEIIAGRAPDSSHDFFPDDGGSVHAPAVNALAALNVFFGDATGRAAVAADLTRGQMAALLTRHADVLVDEGHLEPGSR